MKKLPHILLFSALTLLNFSCKNDVESDVKSEVAPDVVEERGKTVIPGKVEFKERKREPLTQEQINNSNAVMNKLMLNKELSQFSRALVTAGLMADLSNLNSEYTVLAPKNEVFESLPEGKNIVTDPKQREALVALLKMHLIKGRVSSADMVQRIQQNSRMTLTTISGKNLVATLNGDDIQITNAATNKTVTIGKSDVAGTNGILHVVDGFFQ